MFGTYGNRRNELSPITPKKDVYTRVYFGYVQVTGKLGKSISVKIRFLKTI
jgi:hypothetical protein